MSQAEVVFQILREGVQSAHTLIPALLWVGGDSLKEMLLNCMGDSEPLRNLLSTRQVAMPTKDGGGQRATKVVGIVGDAKFIWSMMGCIVNWLRPLLSGPFSRAVMLHRRWIPAVYDRQFFKSIVQLDIDIKTDNFDIPEGFDVTTMRKQLRFFCKHDLGFDIDLVSHFATKFGWESVAVGPLHMGTAIKNHLSQIITIFDCLGLRSVFDRRLRSLRASKIISQTRTRTLACGKRIVDCKTSADHGDYLTAIMDENLWPIRHIDVQTTAEFNHNCELFECDHTAKALLFAVASRLQIDVRFFEVLLMDTHLFRELIMTVHGGNESHRRYLERVRVYDPTAITYKDIHGSLCIGNDEGDGKRWSPSQAYLIFGTREHLFRYANAGMRYRSSQEGHLEHRHPLKKDYIDICALRHAGMLPSDQQQNLTDDNTQDNVERHNILPTVKTQLARVVHASNRSLRTTRLMSKFKSQFREIDDDIDNYMCNYDHQDDNTDPEETVTPDEFQTLTDAVQDTVVTDERMRELGYVNLITDSSSSQSEKCSLVSARCGRHCLRFQRGVTGIQLAVSTSSGAIVILIIDRVKDKLRGARRNGSAQKLVIEMVKCLCMYIQSITQGSLDHSGLTLVRMENVYSMLSASRSQFCSCVYDTYVYRKRKLG